MSILVLAKHTHFTQLQSYIKYTFFINHCVYEQTKLDIRLFYSDTIALDRHPFTQCIMYKMNIFVTGKHEVIICSGAVDVTCWSNFGSYVHILHIIYSYLVRLNTVVLWRF